MFDHKSDYEPYCSFEEWTLHYQECEHREKWYIRKERILMLLQWMCTNQKGKKIKAEEMATRYNSKFGDNLRGTTVVAHMRDLRYDGFPINSDADGYWLNDDLKDIQNTINHLQDKVYAMTYTIKQLYRHFKKINRLNNR